MTSEQLVKDLAKACGAAVLLAIAIGVMEIGLVMAIAAAG